MFHYQITLPILSSESGASTRLLLSVHQKFCKETLPKTKSAFLVLQLQLHLNEVSRNREVNRIDFHVAECLFDLLRGNSYATRALWGEHLRTLPINGRIE